VLFPFLSSGRRPSGPTSRQLGRVAPDLFFHRRHVLALRRERRRERTVQEPVPAGYHRTRTLLLLAGVRIFHGDLMKSSRARCNRARPGAGRG